MALLIGILKARQSGVGCDIDVSLLDTACARVAVSQHATPPEVEDVQRRIEAVIKGKGTVEPPQGRTQRMAGALGALSPSDREALFLREYKGAPYSEIATYGCGGVVFASTAARRSARRRVSGCAVASTDAQSIAPTVNGATTFDPGASVVFRRTSWALRTRPRCASERSLARRAWPCVCPSSAQCQRRASPR